MNKIAGTPEKKAFPLDTLEYFINGIMVSHHFLPEMKKTNPKIGLFNDVYY